MADGNSSSFQTTRELIDSNRELQWGGSDGKSWSEAIDTSTGITVTGTGSVKSDNGIPESVVTQFSPSVFSTGDEVWSDDKTSDGSQDISINGDPKSSTLSNGNPSVLADGNDDYGLFSLPSEFEGDALTGWAIEFEIQISDTSKSRLFSVLQNEQELYVPINIDESFNSDAGNIWANLSDSDGNILRFSPTKNPKLNDGDRHIVTINMIDSTTNDAEFIIDGTSVDTTYHIQESPDNFGTWTNDIAVWADNNAGSIQKYTNNHFGVIRLHKNSVNNQTL